MSGDVLQPASGVVLDAMNPPCRCAHRRTRHRNVGHNTKCLDCDCPDFSPLTALEALEDRLAAQALELAGDMRSDVAQAHRTVRYLNRAELEQLCCVLAAMVDVESDMSQLAWWRSLEDAA